MPASHIPVRPDLDQLRNQAKELLIAIKSGDALAIEELRTHVATQRLANDRRRIAISSSNV